MTLDGKGQDDSQCDKEQKRHWWEGILYCPRFIGMDNKSQNMGELTHLNLAEELVAGKTKLLTHLPDLQIPELILGGLSFFRFSGVGLWFCWVPGIDNIAKSAIQSNHQTAGSVST